MERRSVVNASRQSFEPAVNNEATKSPSVAARAGTREWKRPPAPGEIPVKALSDGGSTPPISTTRVLNKPYFFKGGFAVTVWL